MWQLPTATSLPVAPSGHAVALWSVDRKQGPSGIRARALPASGTPGPVVTVVDDARRVAWPRIALDASGNAVLMWTQFAGKGVATMARRWPAGGELGPAIDLSAPAPATGFNPPSVAVGAGGDALFAWEAKVEQDFRILTRPWPRSAAPDAVAVVSEPGDYSQKPQVVLQAGGAGIVARGASPHDRAAVLLHARRRSATGALGPIRRLGIGDFAAGVALGADGTVYATGFYDIDPEGEILAATLSPSNKVSTTEEPFTIGHLAVRVAARPGGGALLVWSHSGSASVMARSLSPSAELGAPVRVSPRGRPTRQPAIAIGGSGRARVVWIGGRGGARVVETAAGP